MEQLSDTTYADYSGLKVRKHNGTRKMYGNVTFKVPIDNTFTREMVSFIKQGGEYRLLPYKFPSMPFCAFLQNDVFFYEEVCNYTDFIYPAPCPFEAVRSLLRIVKLI